VTHVVRAGDEVSILIEQEGAVSPGVVPTPGDVDVVYEDDYILVLNKPANMPVHPSAGHFDDSLANRCAARFGGVFRPVNRLDAGTSGLMVVARDAHVHALLCKALHTGDFERRYLAVAEGVFAEKQGIVDAPIARVEGSAIQRCVSPDGQRAVTHYRVLRNNSRFSLVELTLETGRTHQIRVHMASTLGCPIAGDAVYGRPGWDRRLVPPPRRQLLHAWKLELKHPVTRQPLVLEAPLPADFAPFTSTRGPS
ncbi:MAG: RluA family pseudouridine synthase, partial [Kiritimatiellia bacterium]